MNNKFDKDSTIEDILEGGINNIFILAKYGMKCAVCPANKNETVERCASSHSVDVESLLKDLNKDKKA